MAFQGKVVKSIGLGIVAFEGTEHLANIITEFRDIVDYVVIGLQRKSYHGDPIDQTDLNEIFRLRDEDHLVDNILEVELDTNKEPRIQETDKRNMIIQDMEDHGCSHGIVIDSDEYYTRKSILRAVQEIDENDYEMTYCQYINYYADYKHFLVYPFKDGMYVPFISKTKYRHTFECTDFPMPSDPTRRYVRPFDRVDKVKLPNGQLMDQKHYTVEYHIFPWETVKMHHLSWLRADMRKKINNWSSKTCFENYNDLIDKAIDTYEHFDENSTNEQIASLLFNTPNHEVLVHAFPKQYIHPKFDFKTRLNQVKQEKKILIMNLSTINSSMHLYEELEKCGRETWAKEVIDGKYPNIDYWAVYDCKEETHVDEKNHIVYVKTDFTKDNIQQLLSRWLVAYDIISKLKQYDYVIRTNTSSWVNIEWMNIFLSYQTDDSKNFTSKFHSAFFSGFNPYASGTLMIWPTRNIPILEKIIMNTPPQILNSQYDDVMMSYLWRVRAESIKLTDPKDCWKSLEGYSLYQEYDKVDWNNIDLNIPTYQIKTFTLNNEVKDVQKYRFDNDIAKLRKIDELWRIYRSNISNEEFEKNVKYYMENCLNKTITISEFTRDEWITKASEFEKQKQHLFNIKPYNDETFKWLENKAIQCGYRKGR